ncbi:PH domain-like protein [Gigaspora margarita]|uniref:PH domain-like protein n=1 Tax=Gigaspora margarita TaxID=4874 RepID=A0A8H4EW23_GIGMA|nr:PH domain-like protein [Gigaspora margarita]
MNGGEPAKYEETVEIPKPISKISHLDRRITNVAKTKFEKAKGDETQKDAITDGEDKKERMQKKRNEEKHDSDVVQDKFEIILNEVRKEYPDAAIQGKFHKESQIFKRYEERYFVFHNGTLYYFKDSKTKKQIKIDKTCKVRKSGNKRFEIETPMRIYKFQASTDDDQSEWCKVVQEYIDYLPEIFLDKKDELPEVPNGTDPEGIQEAVDQAADASK